MTALSTCSNPKCGRPYNLQVPKEWTDKHPELKGLCPRCAAEAISAKAREMPLD